MSEVNQELFQGVLEVLPVFKERENEGNYFSVSAIQRKFRTGYTISARVMDKLESKGYVTEFEKDKPRKILKVR